METNNIYWLAGVLEGEGCFGLSGGCIRISLNMTDKDIVEKAANLLGSSVSSYIPRQKRLDGREKKKVYRTAIFSNNAAAWMMTLYTLMGERRKQTIEQSLSSWKIKRFKNKNGLGRKNPRTKKEGKIEVTIS